MFVGPVEEATAAAALLIKQNRNRTGCDAVLTILVFTRCIFALLVKPSSVRWRTEQPTPPHAYLETGADVRLRKVRELAPEEAICSACGPVADDGSLYIHSIPPEERRKPGIQGTLHQCSTVVA